MENRRYEKLDGIRGIAVLNMIAYHSVWDLVYIYGFNWEWYMSKGAYVWQQGICWTFIFLSGFCCSLGKHTFKRGIIISAGGLIITAATLIVMPQNRIVFGVLTLIGSCMLIMCVLEKVFLRMRIPAGYGIAFSVLLFIVTRNVNTGYLGFERLNFLGLPQWLYNGLFADYIGFTESGFYSTDYFSLFPWLFLFMAGYFTFQYVKGRNALGVMEKSCIKPVEWVGRHSFEIYMVHQPVIYFLLMAMDNLQMLVSVV